MAKVIYKFIHPNHPIYNFYFVQSTFFELPYSIPMDLTTFLLYLHTYEETYLPAFINSWDKIEVLGTSALTSDNLTCDDLLSQDEKQGLYDEIELLNLVLIANKNKERSLYLRNYLNTQNNSVEDVIGEIRAIAQELTAEYTLQNGESNVLFPADYYKSKHFLMSYIYQETGMLIDLSWHPTILKFVYERTNHLDLGLQLYMIPPKYRNSTFFKSECTKRGVSYLYEGITSTNKEFDIEINYDVIAKILSEKGMLYKFLGDVELFNKVVLAISSLTNETRVVDFLKPEVLDDERIVEILSDRNTPKEDDLPF